MMYESYSFDDFYSLRMNLNKRLINLLTAVKLYQDLAKHQIPNKIADRKKIQQQIKGFYSNFYDSNIYYKFLEELRKYSQHAGLPIHLTTFKMGRTSLEEDFSLEYTINFASYFERLKKDKMFSSNKFPKMESKIDIKIAVRHYIESISIIHDSIRKLFVDATTNSRNKIKLAHAKFEKEFDCRTDFLNVCKIEDNNITEKIAILLDWDDVRIKLQKKNKVLTNLSKRYITGMTKPED